MKSKDFVANLREMAVEELREKQVKTEDDIFRLSYQSVTEQNDNTSAIKEKKKDLARIFTILKSRELGLEKQQGV